MSSQIYNQTGLNKPLMHVRTALGVRLTCASSADSTASAGVLQLVQGGGLIYDQGTGSRVGSVSARCLASRPHPWLTSCAR
jgi:hypothetical protein